jgi:Ca2+-binding RTX toxin-like protein
MSKFILSSDFSAYKSGEYTVFNNVWGKGSLVNGTDFYQSVTFNTTNITTGVTFSWSWPTSLTGQIVAYPEIVWGDSPFYDGADETHSYVSKVSDLRNFAVDLDLDVTSGSQYCNLSFDLFLTSKPLGDSSTVTTEVMIWLDNQITRQPWGTVNMGTITDRGHTGTIYFYEGGSAADYIAVVFDKPWLDGSIDIKKVLTDLGAKGLLSIGDYIGGHQFGAEVTGGSGSFTINSISTSFAMNHAPVLAGSIADAAASEDAVFTFQVPTGAFSDRDGDSLTYSATLASGDALPSWLIFDSATRTFSGTAANGDVGKISVNVVVSDGMASVSDVFEIVVANTNDAPTVVRYIANQLASEDSGFSLQIPASMFSDIDGDSLAYSATLANGHALPAWLTFDAATLTLSGTPANGDVGTISVKIVASDGLASVSDAFDIVIANVNDTPILVTALADQRTTEDSAFLFQVPVGVFLDADGDALTYSATLANGNALPTWLSFDSASRTFSGTTANGDVGTISVKVIATDGTASVSDIFNIAVTNTNDAPVVAHLIADQVANEDSGFLFQVPTGFFLDADGDLLTYSATLANGDALPTWLSFDAASRTFSGSPVNGDVGTISVKVIVTDGTASVSDIFNIAVTNTNDAPVVAHLIADQVATEDLGFLFQIAIGAFTDADGDTLTYSATLANGDALPTWLNFDPATHIFSGTPANGDVGTVAVKVVASDGVASISNTFELVVADVNHAPSAIQLSNSTIREDATAGTVVGTLTGTDDSDTILTYALVGGNGTFSIENDKIVLAEGATIDFETGSSYQVVVRATDSAGLYVDRTFTIAVSDVDDKPIIVDENHAPILVGSVGDQSATEDASFQFQIAAGAFSDADGDVLTYKATLANGHALPDWLTFDLATHTFSGKPSSDDVGKISIMVTVSDGQASISDTFDIAIAGIGHAPTDIQLSNSTIAENVAAGAVVGALSGTDDGQDALSYALVGGDNGVFSIVNGNIVLAGGATLNFETKSAYEVVVRATDSGGLYIDKTLTITVADVDETPVIVDENHAPIVANSIADQTVAEQASFFFQIAANAFSDADADTLSYAATLADGNLLPSWLQFDAATRSFSGTPDHGDIGTISVNVTASDGEASISETFDISVGGINHAPTEIKLSKNTIGETADAGQIVGRLTGIDQDQDDKLAFSLTENSSRMFAIEGDRIVLADGKSLDFSVRSSYAVTVEAVDDAGNAFEKAFTIRVTDEAISGNMRDNILHGTDRQDILRGSGGDDVLDGRDGSDKLDGGVGNDTASYLSATRGVVANLGHADSGRGDAHGDTYVSVENLVGSLHNDTLTGNRFANTLDGGKGNDVLTGGAGADIFVFANGSGRDQITDFDTRGYQHDLIDISGLRGISSYRDLVGNHMRDLGRDLMIIADDGSRLIIDDVHSIKDLARADFLF